MANTLMKLAILLAWCCLGLMVASSIRTSVLGEIEALMAIMGVLCM